MYLQVIEIEQPCMSRKSPPSHQVMDQERKKLELGRDQSNN